MKPAVEIPLAKYGTVLQIAVAERLVYRGDFFLATFLRFIPIITTLMLWRAIYDGSGQPQIGGLTYQNMISYYLFVMVARAFGSMPGLASGITRDVREGELRKFLLQPINYVAYLLALRVAHKGVYFAMAGLPFVIVFWLCRDVLPGWPTPAMLAVMLTSLVLSFVQGFLFNCLMGLVAFWFLETSSLMYLVMTLEYFLSGHMFPLSLLPAGLGRLITWMPFAYETYYPTLILVGKISGAEAGGVLLGQAAWIAVLAGLVAWTWRRGLRRYAAFGG
jgi:ABC-2 type transport system permease protein